MGEFIKNSALTDILEQRERMKITSVGGSFLTLLLISTHGHGQVPGKVTNLDVIHNNNRLTVRFTSANIVVSEFELKYAEAAANLGGANFSNDALTEELDESDLISGSLAPPLAPGANVTLHVDPFKVFEGEFQYFFALKSKTELSEWSAVSNIANVIVDPTGDTTPPLPITDLDVTNVNGDLTVSFTCPGDDGMGVARMSIRYAANSNNLNAANFHNDNLNDEVETEDLMSGSSLTPPIIGNTLVTLKLNPSPISGNAEKIFFAVKTADDSFNWSEVSNIASVIAESDPGRVTNLQVTHTHNHLTIKFTAPSIMVEEFAIRYAETAGNLEGNNFSNDALTEELDDSDLITGSMNPPTQPGTNVTLHVDPFKEFEGKSQYFFAMKSEIESSGWSALSNIADVTVETTGDTTPPLIVTDLDVSFVNGDLTVTFTCPGDDGIGVARMSIRYAANSNNLNAANFHNDNLNDEVENEDLMSGSSLTPPITGNTLVTLKLNPSIISGNAGQIF